MNRRRHVAAAPITRSIISPAPPPADYERSSKWPGYRLESTRRTVIGGAAAAAFVCSISLLAAVSISSVHHRTSLRSVNRSTSERGVILRALLSSIHPADGYSGIPQLRLSSSPSPSQTHDASSASLLYIDYRAARGLGHRLTRIAAAYHCK